MKPLISCWILLIHGRRDRAGPGHRRSTRRTPSSANYTPASLAIELRRVKRALEESGDPQALAALPPAWQVETPDRSYSISSEPLRVLLARQADPKDTSSATTRKGAVWLDHLADYLEGSGTASAGSRTQERTELTRILARPEFAGNAPPTRWELFQQRVLNWIRDMLDRIFSFAAQHPSGSKILFWVVITGAIGILGSLALASLDSREPDVVAHSAGTGRGRLEPGRSGFAPAAPPRTGAIHGKRFAWRIGPESCACRRSGRSP